MPRIFLYLAIANMVLLVLSAVIGFVGWEPTPDRHILLGVITLLYSSLLQALTFTYFTVSGKAVTQAIHLARLSREPLNKSDKLKFRLFMQLGLFAGAIVITISTGAYHWRTGLYEYQHLLGAGVNLLVYLFVLVNEYSLIVENRTLVNQVLRSYDVWRSSHGQGTVFVSLVDRGGKKQ